jgi:CheY-like chemotaxis protein
MLTSAQPVEILLIEDNPDDVQLTLHALQKHHISNRIQVLEDGAEALDFLFREGAFANREQDMPKVILLDLKLPKLNGIEVLRKIKEDSRTNKIPVVALTSSREDLDIEKCYGLGVNSYIVKPVDFAQFGDAVREVGLYWLLLNQAPKVNHA